MANSTYAGGTAVTLNGTSKAATTASFYAPTAAGTSGQYLKSTGGTPEWASFSASTVGLGNVTNDAQVKASLGTTKGDMVYWSANATPARLAIGTAGYTLQATANGPAWTQTVAVANGGTGATSFTANSLIISGSTTTAALTTRAITDRTSVSALTNVATWAASTNIPTVNLIAYWDGRYQTTNNASNLAYCNKGAFGNAVTYGVDDATANGALGTGTGLTTERSVYYGLVTVNNASQTRATGIYAPTSAGTANQILVSSGGTSAPTWKATAAGAAYASTANGALTFGTLAVGHGGTGLTTSTYTNAIITGNASTATSAFTIVRTGNGAFYATAQDGAALFGTLPVGQGGTGATSFTANSLIMSGSSTTAALTTRAIYDRTSVNALNAVATWANSTNIPTLNTLAYWDGRYQTTNNASNLTYCKKGAFGDAAVKGITDSSSASAISTGTSLTTERDVYYGLPTINNSHAYTSSTTIYAPTGAGTAGQYLEASGGTSAPVWHSFSTRLTSKLVSGAPSEGYGAATTSSFTLTLTDSSSTFFTDYMPIGITSVFIGGSNWPQLQLVGYQLDTDNKTVTIRVFNRSPSALTGDNRPTVTVRVVYFKL